MMNFFRLAGATGSARRPAAIRTVVLYISEMELDRLCRLGVEHLGHLVPLLLLTEVSWAALRRGDEERSVMARVWCLLDRLVGVGQVALNVVHNLLLLQHLHPRLQLRADFFFHREVSQEVLVVKFAEFGVDSKVEERLHHIDDAWPLTNLLLFRRLFLLLTGSSADCGRSLPCVNAWKELGVQN